MPTAFDVLASDSSDSGSSSENDDDSNRSIEQDKHHLAYEDLTIQREDEETVLAAVYGDDYSKEEGAWGYPILCVHVRPPDIEEERIGSEVK